MIPSDSKTKGSALLDRTYLPDTTSHFRYARFLLFLFLLPILIYGCMFALVRVAGFGYENWGLSKWGPVLNFPFQAQHLDADVVVFGDSTAFLGIDPRLINHEVGIKTIVLPNTIGSLPVTNDLALERYLEHNKTPRLLVFYFGSWNLDYQHNNQKHLFFEGEEMLLRNGSWSDIRAYAVRHPGELLAFPLQMNSTIGWSSLKNAMHEHRSVDVLNTLGHRDYTEPWPAMSESCVIPAKYLDQKSVSSVQALVEKYRAKNISVAVYLAPVPNCRNSESIIQRSYSALTGSGPVTLPAAGFADDGFYGHLRPEKVPFASHLFAQALRSRPDMAAAFQPDSSDSGVSTGQALNKAPTSGPRP